MVAALDVERAALVARAFTIYFHLVNLAEERHRVRALRERARGPEPVPESIEAAVAEIRSREGDESLRREVDRLAVSPVVTAHPTEARRRSVVDALRRIAGLLATLEQAGESQPARAHVERRLLEEITLLWRTDQVRSRRPGPLDEVRTAMVAFDETIFRAVPLLYRELDRALGPDDVGARAPSSRAFVRWGSWAGGGTGRREVTAGGRGVRRGRRAVWGCGESPGIARCGGRTPCRLRRAPAPAMAGRDVRVPPRVTRGPTAFGRPRAGGGRAA